MYIYIYIHIFVYIYIYTYNVYMHPSSPACPSADSQGGPLV